MAFSTMIQQAEKPAPAHSNTPSNDISDALFSMIMLSVYGAQMSKKTVRKLKRKFFFTSLKLKAKSLFKSFTKPRDLSDRQLLYIIAGIAFIVLLILEPVAALVLALLVLILILAGVI